MKKLFTLIVPVLLSAVWVFAQDLNEGIRTDEVNPINQQYFPKK